MAFMECSFKSEILGQEVSFNAIIPQNVENNIKSVYLLHGLSDNHSNWSRFTSVERYAREKGIPVLEYDSSDAYAEACNNFYDTIYSQEK